MRRVTVARRVFRRLIATLSWTVFLALSGCRSTTFNVTRVPEFPDLCNFVQVDDDGFIVDQHTGACPAGQP